MKKQFVSQQDRYRFSDQHYFKSINEMETLFHDLPEALSNTIEISKGCSYRPEIKKSDTPVFIKGTENSEKDL